MDPAPTPLDLPDFDGAFLGAYQCVCFFFSPFSWKKSHLLSRRPLGASLEGFFGGGLQESLADPMEVEDESPGAAAEDENTGEKQAEMFLDELDQFLLGMTQELEELYVKQRQLLMAGQEPARENVQQLNVRFENLSAALSSHRDRTVSLRQSVLLSPAQMHRIETSALSQMDRILARVRLAENELRGDVNAPRAALVVVRQPFPAVYTKGKSVEEGELHVEFLLAPATQCASAGPVRATLVMDPAVEAKARGGKSQSASLSNAEAALNGSRRAATLAPRFDLGTRKTVAKLEFSAEMKPVGSTRAVSVHGAESRGVIVITNESQWAEAEAESARLSVFGVSPAVSWSALANFLGLQFLHVTRQDPEAPNRGLSQTHLAYLKQCIGNCEVVDRAAFENFYAFYGKCLGTLKYQRFVGALWTAGLVAGFVSRENVAQILKNRPVGTFLLRFSERHGGSLTVGYVGVDLGVTKVKHYLIQPSDVASSKRTVCDFLSDQSQFQTMICFRDDGNVEAIDKDAALGGFVSKKETLEAPGYETKIT